MLSLSKNGFGSLALLSLMGGCTNLNNNNTASRNLTSNKLPHYVPKAKSIIFLYMDGGISQVDAFDPQTQISQRKWSKSI